MDSATAIVVTSINAPNAAMRELTRGAVAAGAQMIVIGDIQSPSDFLIEGSRFLSIRDQIATGFKFAGLCPSRSYARKNVGYLVAAAGGAKIIVETDDDNFPRPAFFGPRFRSASAGVASNEGWLNVYRHFTDANIWPRGLPLDHVGDAVRAFEDLSRRIVDAPIQQGLADENPDVDAVYRLMFSLPQSFRADRAVALGKGSWCPFNSQNTTWWEDAFPLLYLPSFCSIRMTDIWRSFVAQRIAWENGWHVLFHAATVRQERNDHDLMRDFADEIPGYLHNDRIRKTLEDLPLRGGKAEIMNNIRACYAALVKLDVVASGELPLIEAWAADLEGVLAAR